MGEEARNVQELCGIGEEARNVQEMCGIGEEARNVQKQRRTDRRTVRQTAFNFNREGRCCRVNNRGNRTAVLAGGLAAALSMTGLLAGCGGKSGGGVVHMATKPMTEQYIMGYMMRDLIQQDTDLTVDVTEGVGGGVANIQPALEKGEFDFYPEYTGTGWNAVLKEDSLYDESMFGQLQAGYGALGLTWTGMLGFNNTFGLAVTRAAAEECNLKTYSDLAAVSDRLTFGAEYDFFEREDGYDALQSTYGMNFADTVDLDIGLKYDAVNQGKIDAMNIFTTDGQLSVADIVVLEDDKGLYPSYMCGFVVRQDTLEQYPELQAVFDRVTGLITDGEMAEMNYLVEAEGVEPEDAARNFLQAKGLLS